MLPQLPGLVLSSQPKPQHTNFQPKTPPAASPGFSLFPNYRDLFLWPPWARSKPGQLRESFHSLLDLSSWSFSYNKLPIICWFLFNYPPEAADISLPRSLGARRRLPVHSQAPKLGTVGSVGLCPRFFGAEYSQNQTQGGEFLAKVSPAQPPLRAQSTSVSNTCFTFFGKKTLELSQSSAGHRTGRDLRQPCSRGWASTLREFWKNGKLVLLASWRR